MNDLVNSRITLRGAQGLVNQILKQEPQLSERRYRILDQEIESFFFELSYSFICKEIRLYNIEIF